MTYDELADYCKEASKTISELDYKNRMLDKENQELKKQLDKASLTIQEMTERDIYCPNSCDKLEELSKENQELKEKLLVTQTNEETFRLEMEDITKTLGLDENTLFDDVKVYTRNLKNNWNKLKKWLYEEHYLYVSEIAKNSTYQVVLNKMQELEQGSDSDE